MSYGHGDGCPAPGYPCNCGMSKMRDMEYYKEQFEIATEKIAELKSKRYKLAHRWREKYYDKCFELKDLELKTEKLFADSTKDFLLPLESKTKEEWRRSAVFHENNSYRRAQIYNELKRENDMLLADNRFLTERVGSLKKELKK